MIDSTIAIVIVNDIQKRETTINVNVINIFLLTLLD